MRIALAAAALLAVACGSGPGVDFDPASNADDPPADAGKERVTNGTGGAGGHDTLEAGGRPVVIARPWATGGTAGSAGAVASGGATQAPGGAPGTGGASAAGGAPACASGLQCPDGACLDPVYGCAHGTGGAMGLGGAAGAGGDAQAGTCADPYCAPLPSGACRITCPAACPTYISAQVGCRP